MMRRTPAIDPAVDLEKVFAELARCAGGATTATLTKHTRLSEKRVLSALRTLRERDRVTRVPRWTDKHAYTWVYQAKRCSQQSSA